MGEVTRELKFRMCVCKETAYDPASLTVRLREPRANALAGFPCGSSMGFGLSLLLPFLSSVLVQVFVFVFLMHLLKGFKQVI